MILDCSDEVPGRCGALRAAGSQFRPEHLDRPALGVEFCPAQDQGVFAVPGNPADTAIVEGGMDAFAL